ncbi:MAG TPA: hypothetical protein VGI75_09160 [Pirellulales bacterium]|jgi:hypothetical protein
MAREPLGEAAVQSEMIGVVEIGPSTSLADWLPTVDADWRAVRARQLGLKRYTAIAARCEMATDEIGCRSEFVSADLDQLQGELETEYRRFGKSLTAK